MQHLTEQSVVYSAKSDTEKSFDYILPEYLPGISRIIKTSASIENCTFSANIAEPADNVSLKISIMYISEYDGKIKCASFRQEVICLFREAFTHTGEYTAVPSCFISFIQAFVQSPRKLTVKFVLQSGITAYSESKAELFSDNDKDGICSVKKHFSSCTKKIITEAHFEKNEEITIDTTKPGVRDILRTDACFMSIDAKASDGRIDFDAKVNLRILYENANDNEENDTEYACLDTVITLGDALNCENIDENDIPYLYIDVYSAEPSVSLDPYGENRIISLSVKYTLSGFAYKTEEFEAITDAFLQGCQNNPEYKEFSVDSVHSAISKTETISISPHTDIREVTDISSCNAKIQSVSIEHSEGQFFANTRCMCEVLGTNLSGELSGFDVPAILRIPLGGNELTRSDTIPDVLINIKSCSGHIKEGSLKMDFEVGINGVFVSREKHNLVSSLDCSENPVCDRKKGEIIVYYPSKSDSLWDVAKKYRISPEKICLANKEDEKTISSRNAIIIP